MRDNKQGKQPIYVLAFRNRNLYATVKGTKEEIRAITLALLSTDWQIVIGRKIILNRGL